MEWSGLKFRVLNSYDRLQNWKELPLAYVNQIKREITEMTNRAYLAIIVRSCSQMKHFILPHNEKYQVKLVSKV